MALSSHRQQQNQESMRRGRDIDVPIENGTSGDDEFSSIVDRHKRDLYKSLGLNPSMFGSTLTEFPVEWQNISGKEVNHLLHSAN